LVIMAVRYNLIGELRTGVLANYYVDVPRKIRSGEVTKSAKVFREIRPIYPSDIEFKDAFLTKSIRNAEKARFILVKIENSVNKDTRQVITDPKKVSLEHILPKNPSREWANTLRSVGEQLDEYTYRIGNLALLSATDNKRGGSKNFETKKTMLFTKENQLSYTRMIADYSLWLKEDIDDRQRKLAEQAVKVWRVDIT
jgi:hypothetical protein